MEAGSNNSVVSSLEENLKKALTELMILKLLSERDYYIGELTGTIRERSGNILSIVFPYAAFYRMIERGYIDEVKKGLHLMAAAGSTIRSLTRAGSTSRHQSIHTDSS